MKMHIKKQSAQTNSERDLRLSIEAYEAIWNKAKEYFNNKFMREPIHALKDLKKVPGWPAMGRSFIMGEIRKGKLKPKMISNRYYFYESELQRYLDES